MTDILKLLKESGFIREGHFIGKKTGRHFSTFIDKDNLLVKPSYFEEICRCVADISLKSGPIDVVAGPFSGGGFIAQRVAGFLGGKLGIEINAVFLEKDGQGGFSFRPGFARLVAGKRVLIVEDVVRTGASLREAIQTVRNAGGIVVSAVVILNRAPGIVSERVLGAPLHALVDFPEQGFDDKNLPAWLARIPVAQKRIIGITGRIGAGKSTLAKEILRRFPGAERIATGDILKKTLFLWGLPQTRGHLGTLSKAVRENFGDHVIADVVRRNIAESSAPLIIIDGVRGPRVLEILREYKNPVLIAVISDPEKRFARIAARIEKPDETGMNYDQFLKVEEKGFQKQLEALERQADFVIPNDLTEEEFIQRVHAILDTVVYNDVSALAGTSK